MNILSTTLRLATAAAATALWVGSAAAAPLPGYPSNSASLFASVMRGDVPDAAIEAPAVAPSTLAPELRRQVVNYPTRLAPGTIVVDTSSTFLYLVLSDGQALRYGIGVGRDGFGWSGEQTVTRKAEWPDWTPPQEMIERQPYLPRWMAGGEGNPLGARALYLGSTVYRIHGTNAPETIGQRVSSGCIRMLNADVMDLYSRVNVGTRIVVLKGRDEAAAKPAVVASAQIAAPRAGALRMPGIY